MSTQGEAAQRGERRRPKSGWPAICGLLLLSMLPVLGGVTRLAELGAASGGAAPTHSPVPVVAHVAAMSVYCVLGAFQYSPALRRRPWHRAAGRVLIPAGFLAALSAVWLAVFYRGPEDEVALAMIRLVFAAAMTVFLALSVSAIRRRDFAAHGAWMTRAYAIAVAGGTQALVFTLWYAIAGEVDSTGEMLLVAASFAANSAAAERLVRRRAARRQRRAQARGARVS